MLVIADDDADMRALVRDVLRSEFPEAIEVADGRQLFWQLMRSSFGVAGTSRDLVIVTDLRMPTYSGLDVLDAWHDPATASPMVVITAFPDDTARQRARRLDAALLAKPFSRAQLREAVRDAVRRTRGKGEMP
ncbi:MAG TPA: response regulator [Kofleriaceae bacterium]|nr:response regulator [Kofleriaceae bacterium]